jgi:hypothetical protein
MEQLVILSVLKLEKLVASSPATPPSVQRRVLDQPLKVKCIRHFKAFCISQSKLQRQQIRVRSVFLEVVGRTTLPVEGKVPLLSDEVVRYLAS